MKSFCYYFILLLILVSSLSIYIPRASANVTLGKPPYMYALSSGLVGHWTFDGKDMAGGVARDRSGQGNNGNLKNIATSTFYTQGKIGQALNFDASDDYITVADPGTGSVLDFADGSSITISTWINLSNLSYNNYINILEKPAPIAANYNLQSPASGVGAPRKLAFYLALDGSAEEFHSDSAVLTESNRWYHVVFSYTFGTGASAKYYLDSVAIGGSWVLGDGNGVAGTSNTALIIGAQSSFAEVWNGKIDDLRIYNRILSATEIKQLYNFGSAKLGVTPRDPLTSGLVGHWTFDGKDMTGGVARDRSGQGNNGNLKNIATSTFYTPGKIGQGAKFDGVDDRVLLASDPVGVNTVTICAWIYPTRINNGNFQAIIANTLFVIGLYLQDARILLDSNDGNGTLILSTIGSIQENTWTHTCAIRNSSGTGEIYINGVSNASGDTGTPVLPGGVLIAIGDNFDQDFPWNGNIDDVRIYNRALSATEIRQLYNIGR